MSWIDEAPFSVMLCQREASAENIRISHSDSEYELLLLIYILSSYLLYSLLDGCALANVVSGVGVS